MSDKQLKVYNSDKMKGDFVIFHNPSSWLFVDMTPQQRKFKLEPGEKKIIPKKLAIWFIGDYESPFWKNGVGTDVEMAAIYSRNRYHEIFCRVLGPAPEDGKPDIEEDINNPQELLKDLAENPKKIIIDESHLERVPVDPERAGGPNFG